MSIFENDQELKLLLFIYSALSFWGTSLPEQDGLLNGRLFEKLLLGQSSGVPFLLAGVP